MRMDNFSYEKNKDNIFGIRLKNLRQVIMKQTQKEFSDFIGIPQSTLSTYESGRNKPTLGMAISIANKCNVSIDWLCGREKRATINSLGDLMSILFQIYEAREFSCKTTIHDNVDIEETGEVDDALRNWIQMTFYYNEGRLHPEQIYCGDICNMIKKAYELHMEFSNYDCSKDYYETKKQQFIDRYSKHPVTTPLYPDISEEERHTLCLKRLRAELENELKNTSH